MPHMLATLTGVKAEDIAKVLKDDASIHAGQGLYLEHLWQNVDDPDEVLFLFRTTNLDRAKQFIEKVHTQARQENPGAHLPRMTFLAEVK